MGREDRVWRADTGHYHARAPGFPVLMPPMLDAPAGLTTREASHGQACFACVFRAWFASQEASNLLTLLLVIATVALVLQKK